MRKIRNVIWAACQSGRLILPTQDSPKGRRATLEFGGAILDASTLSTLRNLSRKTVLIEKFQTFFRVTSKMMNETFCQVPFTVAFEGQSLQ